MYLKALDIVHIIGLLYLIFSVCKACHLTIASPTLIQGSGTSPPKFSASIMGLATENIYYYNNPFSY